MVVSIGIECNKEDWRACLLENGRTLELRPLHDPGSALEYINQRCILYPEPIIAVSVSCPDHQTHDFLQTLEAVHFNTYKIPPINQLASVPRYRKQYRLDMGSSSTLCAVAALAFRMRKLEATWQEMRFLYLEAGYLSRSIVVVEDGRIVNGIGDTPAGYDACQRGESSLCDRQDQSADETTAEQAYWEELTEDLAGLLAIHHLEDIVVAGRRKDDVVERLEDRYQFYLFPHAEYEQQEFDATIGAAIIAEGLYHPGRAAEVVERLQIPAIKPGGNIGNTR
ncbi:MAG TPA: DUF1464 family protein [Ktedonobacteraceae bacterium]|nr:DUF1464 family protein [Ktedonobacteraceae bacterium]